MSGYKRVSFYELCRLCASNHQKDKTHIFQEEGRNIQLQNKIQSCLALKVCEDDLLPKVVCGKCLRSLELCFNFRQESVRSESMLSSYFKNFRYTEDFKKSGKVYIKDIKPPPILEIPSSSTINNNLPKNVDQMQNFYTLQLPTSIPNTKPNKPELTNDKSPNAYNLNTIAIKTMPPPPPPQQPPQRSEMLSNVVVNSNGEVINIGQLVDIDSIMNTNANNVPIKIKKSRKKAVYNSDIVKIDLTNENPNANQPEPLKSNKYSSFTVKMDDFNQPPNYNIYNAQTAATTVVPTQNQVSLVNSTIIPPCNANTATATNADGSTVNINVLPADSEHKSLKQHVCDICTKSFKRREHLYQHIKLHTGFRPYICEQCNKAFMRKEHLLRHMTLHSGQKNFTCDVCDKSFSRNDNLLKHKKTHEKQTSYTCEICLKQFVMKHYYAAHKMTHVEGHLGGGGANVWGLLKT